MWLRSVSGMAVEEPHDQRLPAAEERDPAEVLRLVQVHRIELLTLAARHRAKGVATIAGAPWLLVTFATGASVSDHVALDAAIAPLTGATGTVVAAGSPAARAIDPDRITPL